MNKLQHHPSSFNQFFFRQLIIIAFIGCFSFLSATAQNKIQLVGYWQLQKVSFKNMVTDDSENNKEQLLNIFKAALYEQLTDEQQSILEDLEIINSEAKLLFDKYYLTSLEFKPNSAFYNTSIDSEKSLSGEYLLDKKKLLMEWETANNNIFKIIKTTANELVLKDTKLKIIFYYTKTKI